ncbi:MAG TPA: hypothetical protein VJ914_19200 [Pseudonocardiaceae bacterium]|nr:hypothetical protein [Pseudonocardiaceae bacterium]
MAGDDQRAAELAEEVISVLAPLAAGKPARYGKELLHARFVLAMAYVRLGRPADAAPALESYVRMLRLAPVEREPNLTRSLRLLVDAWRQLGRPADAVPHAEVLVRLARINTPQRGRFELAMALCEESTCHRLAGRPAVDGAIEAVRLVCGRAVFDLDGGVHALSRALIVLDEAHGAEHDPKLVEIRRRLAARPVRTDIHEWLADARQDRADLTTLLELSTPVAGVAAVHARERFDDILERLRRRLP